MSDHSLLEKETLLEENMSSSSLDTEKDEWTNLNSSRTHLQREKLRSRAHIGLLYLVIGGLLSFLLVATRGVQTYGIYSELIYSPAQSAVSYEIREFEPAFFVANDYMGYPNAKNNKLWEDLYNFGISGVTESEASKLINETIPIRLPDGSITHLIELDVFHQLHCLNSLRQSLYEDAFPLWEYHENGTRRYDTIAVRHWDHCLDALRQTLMCHGDTTPVVFHYNHTSRGSFPKLNAVHTCKNWDALVDWAKTRQVDDYEILPPSGEKSVGDIGIDIDDA